MKKLLLLLIVAVAFSASASAAAIDTPCVNGLTVGTLITSGGCWIQDKIFTNWTYTGGGTVAAANVGINVIFSVVPGTEIHGFTFTPEAAVWGTSFTLGYTIAILSGPNSIVSAQDQLLLGEFPNLTSGVSTKGNGEVYVMSQALATDGSIFATPVLSLTSSTAVTIPAGAGNFVASLEEVYTQADTVIPEPMTFLLIGTGLVGLGLLRRRARKS